MAQILQPWSDTRINNSFSFKAEEETFWRIGFDARKLYLAVSQYNSLMFVKFYE